MTREKRLKSIKEHFKEIEKEKFNPAKEIKYWTRQFDENLCPDWTLPKLKTKVCWQCGKEKASVHKAKVITATGVRELDLCDECHMYWGGD